MLKCKLGIAADFVLIVVAGFFGAMLARALRMPLLVGYVAAGVMVGPNTIGPTVGELHEIELLAEIGVALLLFSLGMEISLRDLQAVKRIALIGGTIQVVLTASLAAAAGIHWLGMPTTDAAWFGAMVALSSTMVVLKTLSVRGVTSTLASRVMIGLLVLQDLAVIPILIILPGISNLQGALSGLIRPVAIAAAFLAGMVIVGTRLLPLLLHKIALWGSRELFLVAVVAAGVGTGYIAHMLGLSFALGAFVAGIVMSESELSHQAFSDVVPLRDIFGLLFFVSVGMLLDPGYVSAHGGRVAATVGAIIAGKAILFFALARAFGYRNMAPWLIGLGLAQVGEFSFVLARSGLATGMLSKSTYDLALTSTIITMGLSPMVSAAAVPLGRWWRGRSAALPAPVADAAAIEAPKEALQNHVIVAGYGRTGRAIAAALKSAGVPFVVIEFDHASYHEATHRGYPALWGDTTSPEILRAAGIEKAAVAVMAVPDQSTIRLCVERVKATNPRVAVVARAVREHHIAELKRLGVAATVQPEFEGGLEMVRQALLLYGRSDDSTRVLMTLIRRGLYEEGLTDEQLRESRF
ncbi:MAG: cation:proton antiporter [Acidobacteriota bacterium]